MHFLYTEPEKEVVAFEKMGENLRIRHLERVGAI
jgi:hypothetical protein